MFLSDTNKTVDLGIRNDVSESKSKKNCKKIISKGNGNSVSDCVKSSLLNLHLFLLSFFYFPQVLFCQQIHQCKRLPHLQIKSENRN